jgi:hypothetical protein
MVLRKEGVATDDDHLMSDEAGAGRSGSGSIAGCHTSSFLFFVF